MKEFFVTFYETAHDYAKAHGIKLPLNMVTEPERLRGLRGPVTFHMFHNSHQLKNYSSIMSEIRYMQGFNEVHFKWHK